MKTEVELITKSKADAYLRANVRNRPVKRWLVDRYKQLIRAGRWSLTHQGIAISVDGVLLDGQHRLIAISECDTPVMVNVTIGVPNNAQFDMDTGMVRDVADQMTLLRNERIDKKHVAIIKFAIRKDMSSNNTREIANYEVNDVFDTFRPAIQFVDSLFPKKTIRGITSAPVMAGVTLAWFYVQNLERLEEFCHVLSGNKLASGGEDRAAIMLREWLLRNGAIKHAEKTDAFKKTQRAIVAFLARQDIGKLYGTDTFFPWPLVEPMRLEAGDA